MITKKSIKMILRILISVFTILGVSTSAFAIVGQLGVLDVSGDNPATGQPWAEGDTYRLAFVTSGTRDATSPDIADYHDFVQAAADAAGLGGAVWLCLGQSINDTSRIANTGVTGQEGPVYLVDGATKLWDVYGGFGTLANLYNMTETGGTYSGSVATGSSRKFGDPAQPKIEHGNSGRLDGAWWQVYNGAQSSQWHFYAVSERLTVMDALIDPNLPTVDAGDNWITWSGEAVTFNAVVTNNDTNEPQRALSYVWTASPAEGVVFTPNDGGDGSTSSDPFPTVTITGVAGNPTVVTIALAVTLEGEEPVTDTLTIDVYDDSCEAAKGAVEEVSFDETDFNQDCVTDIKDVAIMAESWLVNYSLTAPAEDVE